MENGYSTQCCDSRSHPVANRRGNREIDRHQRGGACRRRRCSRGLVIQRSCHPAVKRGATGRRRGAPAGGPSAPAAGARPTDPRPAFRPVHASYRSRRVLHDQDKSGPERHRSGRGPCCRPRPQEGLPGREVSRDLQRDQYRAGRSGRGSGRRSHLRAQVRRAGHEAPLLVNQGGNWILQHDAALALLQAATS